jgi:retron-type reverse transcriptase
VQNLPLGKSPGLDGFNTDFMMKCWTVIAQDFYDLCDAFYENNLCIQSINDSYITLIPKIDNPSKVSNYRPISLLNSSIKVLTKLLANRLQKVILRLIHQNKYSFIRSRSIQDCVAWSFEYLHLCHKSKRELIILKLDFEKAFDKVEHEVIIQVMEHMRFPIRWITWIKNIMRSGTSAVILNGVPRKVFHCIRGVRQGDLLSPLPFVLAAELL